MVVSEYERTQLFNWFEEHMGTERATTMMNLLPPVGWGDVATRRDLELLEERIDHRFELVEARFDRLEARLDARIDSVDQRLGGRIDVIEARLGAMTETMATKADVVDSRYELQKTLVTWMLLAQATVVAAVGLLIAYLG